MTYTKPLPDLENPTNAPFWAGTKEHKLIMQRCPKCSYFRWPPGHVCPECQTLGEEWVEIRPSGSLLSYNTYYRALDPRFKDDIPYSVGLIQLDDGPRIIGTVLGDPESLVVDALVRAVFDDVTSEVTLVRWEMVS